MGQVTEVLTVPATKGPYFKLQRFKVGKSAAEHGIFACMHMHCLYCIH